MTRYYSNKRVLIKDYTLLKVSFGSYSGIGIRDNWYIDKIGTEYRPRQIYGYAIVGEFHLLKPWKPQEWNGFCFIFQNNRYDIILNNDKVISSHLEESSRSVFQNISRLVLMSKGMGMGIFQPFYGAITDLHIWKRFLTNKEITDFNDCKLQLGGDVYQWNPDNLSLFGSLAVEDISREEYCGQSQQTTLVANGKLRNFYESIDFCNDVLKGRMAVGKNEDMLRAMGEEIRAFECSEMFYSGYINVGNHKYLDFYDKHPMNLRKVDFILEINKL